MLHRRQPTESFMDTDVISAKAEFYLMLSRAFLPPTAPDSHDAFVNILPEELREIGAAAGYDGFAHRDATVLQKIDTYAALAAGVADRTRLLQIYSGFFLMPPREVQLYVSAYLDGNILGKSCDALLAFYRKHDLAHSDDFHDLPDHLSAVLEFLALLYARAAETDGYARADLLNDARDLNRVFLLSWLPVMRRQLAHMQQEANEHGGADVMPAIYPQLAEILEAALVADAGDLSAELRQVLSPETRMPDHHEDAKEMAKCVDCGADIAPAARIRRVRKVLEKEGIDTGHLDLCPRCRGSDMFPSGVNFPRV